MHCSTPGFPVHHHLPESSQAHVHHFEMPSNHLILCFPLYFLPSTFPSIRVFSNESVLRIRFPKYWSFSFSISPSHVYSGLIPLQCKGLSRVFSNTTVQKHQFFGAQLSLQYNSHPYMTTGKTIVLTRQPFVIQLMSLLFNMLSSLVITFLPRRKHLLISAFQSTSEVILESPKIKYLNASTVPPSICHEVMVQNTMILVF